MGSLPAQVVATRAMAKARGWDWGWTESAARLTLTTAEIWCTAYLPPWGRGLVKGRCRGRDKGRDQGKGKATPDLGWARATMTSKAQTKA